MSVLLGIQPESQPERGDWWVILLIGLAHAQSHFSHLVVPLLFPWLMPEFGLSFTEAGALMAVFFFISGFGQALAGLVVDRVGPRPVMFFGVLLLGFSGVLLGYAQNYSMLMMASAMAGAGNCVFHPADYTVLNRQVSKARLGHAFSVHGLSGNLGWALAPLFVTAIATQFGWRAAAFSSGALALIPFVSLFYLKSEMPRSTMSAHGPGGIQAVSTWTVLSSPTVLNCFVFFFLLTVAFGAMQNFSTAALRAVYGLSLTGAATALSAYMLGAAAGIAAGGFLANRGEQEKLIAVCVSFGACISLVLACDMVPGWAILPLMALMGFGIGIAGPSRDLLVRKAATQGMGEASYGRVYGFVYSGIDSGQAAAPLIFGSLMDGSHFSLLWIGIAVFQMLAVVSVLRVGYSMKK